jgi:hypothetical protein
MTKLAAALSVGKGVQANPLYVTLSERWSTFASVDILLTLLRSWWYDIFESAEIHCWSWPWDLW